MREDKMIYTQKLKHRFLILYYEEKLRYHTLREKLKLRFLKEHKLVKKYVYHENDSEKNDFSTRNEI
jgi:hypothetical protein